MFSLWTMLASIMDQKLRILLKNMVRASVQNEILHSPISPGVRIEYLPAYSPDFNPIEQAFSVIKSHLRRSGIHFFNEDAAYYEMYRCFQLITPEMTYGFFRHSGYFLG